jgi:hypothetical protein
MAPPGGAELRSLPDKAIIARERQIIETYFSLHKNK